MMVVYKPQQNWVDDHCLLHMKIIGYNWWFQAFLIVTPWGKFIPILININSCY